MPILKMASMPTEMMSISSIAWKLEICEIFSRQRLEILGKNKVMSITSLEKIKNWQGLSRNNTPLFFLILFSSYLDNASETKVITVFSKEFRRKFWKNMYFPAYLWKTRIINFILSVSFLTHDYRRVGFHCCHSFFWKLMCYFNSVTACRHYSLYPM